jgi:hypothetical protein
MSKSILKRRYIFIDSRIRKKKREYHILVKQYDPSLRYTKPIYYNYPEFRKTFPTKRQAREYAFKMIDKLEARYKNLRFIAYELFE